MRSLSFFIFIVIISCQSTTEQTAHLQNEPEQVNSQQAIIDARGKTIKTRFPAPRGFLRKEEAKGSFAEYLRNIELLPDGSPVKFYDGTLKSSLKHAVVLKMDVGERDLQQCADAIMRLRAEYFYYRKEYDKIAFHFVNGFKAEYARWAKGERIGIQGNRAYWYQNSSEDYSYSTFKKYLTMVYSFAGTASLVKELKPKKLETLEVGDVFIQGGSPGHAMLVMDVVADENGEKLFLLAQSYMPAQSMHVVINPANDELSPWYSLSAINNVLDTPSWDFYPSNLKSF